MQHYLTTKLNKMKHRLNVKQIYQRIIDFSSKHGADC